MNISDLLILLVIPWLAFLARQAGGGRYSVWLVYQLGTRYGAWWGSAGARVPELFWAVTIACIAVGSSGLDWYTSIPLAALAYFSMEFGHGNAYHMGFEQHAYLPRHQTLDAVVLPICRIFVWENRSPQYCWLFMGLKGLLIGIPLLPAGIALAALWPLAYYISFRNTATSVKAEWYSGAFAGVVCCLAWWMS